VCPTHQRSEQCELASSNARNAGIHNEATFDGKAAGGMDEHSGVCGMFELTPKMTEDAERALKAYGMEVVDPHPG
jgi:hypothetical protein